MRERAMPQPLLQELVCVPTYVDDRDYSSHRRIFADVQRDEYRSSFSSDLFLFVGFRFFVHLAVITIDSRVAPWALVSYKLSQGSPPLI